MRIQRYETLRRTIQEHKGALLIKISSCRKSAVVSLKDISSTSSASVYDCDDSGIERDATETKKKHFDSVFNVSR